MNKAAASCVFGLRPVLMVQGPVTKLLSCKVGAPGVGDPALQGPQPSMVSCPMCFHQEKAISAFKVCGHRLPTHLFHFTFYAYLKLKMGRASTLSQKLEPLGSLDI